MDQVEVTALTDEIQVNQHTEYSQEKPQVTALFTGGKFVVSWVSTIQDGTFYEVYARVFNNSGMGSMYL